LGKSKEGKETGIKSLPFIDRLICLRNRRKPLSMEGSSHNLKGIQWEYKGKGRKNGE